VFGFGALAVVLVVAGGFAACATVAAGGLGFASGAV
jgi:hypothetical protein